MSGTSPSTVGAIVGAIVAVLALLALLVLFAHRHRQKQRERQGYWGAGAGPGPKSEVSDMGDVQYDVAPRTAFRHESFMALVKDAAKGFYVPELDAQAGGMGAGVAAGGVAAGGAAAGVGNGTSTSNGHVRGDGSYDSSRHGRGSSGGSYGVAGGARERVGLVGAPAGAKTEVEDWAGPSTWASGPRVGEPAPRQIPRRSGSSGRSLQFLETGSGSPASPPHIYAQPGYQP